MNNKLISVALYIRVSTEEQVKNGYSIQAQKENLIEYCEKNNYKVIDSYIDEGKSARSKINNRTALKKLLEDVKKKKFNRILFIKLDRWFRNISDYYKVQEILDKYKVDWETTQENYNTTTSSGRLNLNIRLSIAQDEADRTADRIKFVFESMIKNGRARVGKQGLPLGYNIFTLDDGKKVIKKDSKEKKMVEDIFAYFSTFVSIRKTLIYINQKYNLSISYSTLSKLLRNPFYTGKYRDVINYTEPYVTVEEFDKIQKLLCKNNGFNQKKHDYVFSGLIICNVCGSKLSGHKHSSRKYNYYGYRCYKQTKKLCNNTSGILENKLEQLIIQQFFEEIEKRKNVVKTEITDYDPKKIDSLNLKLDRLNDMYLNSRIDKKKYDDEYNKILQEKLRLEEQLNKAKIPQKKELHLNSLDIYKKLDNASKNAFWKKYINYIENTSDRKFIAHFK